MEKTLAQSLAERKAQQQEFLRQDRENLAKAFDEASRRFDDLSHAARTQPDADVVDRYRKLMTKITEDFYYAERQVTTQRMRIDELGYVVAETERYEREHESMLPNTESILDAIETLVKRVKELG